MDEEEQPYEEYHTPVGKLVMFILATLFFLAGLSLYIIWAALYNAWFDIGLYSVSFSMMLIGLVEMYIHFPTNK